MSQRAGLGGLLICAVLALNACSGNPANPTSVPVTASGLEPRLVIVRPGTTTTVIATFTDDHGAPYEPFSFVWSAGAGDSADATVVISTPGPGQRRIDYTPKTHHVNLISAFVLACPACLEHTYENVVTMVVAGGDGNGTVEPAQEPPNLIVGEQRALAAVAATSSADTSTLTGDPLVFSTDDPAIATIDAHGLITAIAPGETVVRFTDPHGAASQPVRVTPGTLGPPATGKHVVARRPFDSDSTQNPKTDHQLAVDSRGYPVALIHTRFAINYGPVVVAQWTGSGFGGELVGDDTDAVGMASLGLDERDHLYVSYVSFGLVPRLVVAERGRDAGPGGWTSRVLPQRVLLDRGAEPTPADTIANIGTLDTAQRFALRPRPGGGMWIAYFVFGSDPELGKFRTLRLVEVTDAGIVATDVERFSFLDDKILYAPRNLFILPQPGGGPPDLVAQYVSGGNGNAWGLAWRYHATGSTWTAVQYLPDPNGTAQEQNPGVHAPIHLGLAEPLAPAAPVFVWTADKRVFHDEMLWHVLGTSPALTPFYSLNNPVRGGAATWNVYALAHDGVVYTGDDAIGPLRRITAQGVPRTEDPSPLFADVQDPAFPDEDTFSYVHAYWTLRGATAHDGRLHWLMDTGTHADLEYVVVTPPHAASPTGTELDGTRLSAQPDTPASRGAIRLIDGTRIVAAPPGIWRSPTDGAPFTTTNTGADNIVYSGDFFAMPDALYALEDGFVNLPQLRRSTDGGQTWQVRATVAPLIGAETPRIQAARRVGTAMFVLISTSAGNLVRYTADFTTAGVVFSDLPAPSALESGGDETMFLGNATTLTVITRMPSFFAKLHLRTWNAAGVLIDDYITGPRGDHAGIPVWHASVRTATGALVWLHAETTIHGFTFTVMRSVDGLRTEQAVASLGPDWVNPTPIVTLADGRLALGLSRRSGRDQRRAAYVTSSDDGVTWSAPIDLRPQGGQGQQVFSLTPLDGGGLQAVIGDNGAMRAFESDTNTFGQVMFGFGVPPMDTVIVRVP